MKNTASVVLGLACLAALGWGIYALLSLVFSTFAGLDKSVAATIVVTCGTVIISLLTIVIGRVWEQQTLIQKEHRERKIPIYLELLGFLFRFLTGEKTGKMPSETEVLEFLEHFNKDFMVWGSDGVVKAWAKFRQQSTTDSVDATQSMLLLEKLILEIRRDLGHKNKQLVDGDLLSLFINDVHTILNKPSQP